MKRILVTFTLIFASLSIFAGTLVYTPSLVAPENGAEYVMADVTLNWRAVAGSTDIHYEYQISTDEAFTNPIIAFTELSAAKAPYLNFGVTYFWKVRAIDGDDISDWSEIWNFTVIDHYNLNKPNDGVTGQVPNITLKWEGEESDFTLSGVDFFEIVLDTAETFMSAAPYHIVYMEEAAPLYDDKKEKAAIDAKSLLFGEKFFWKVRGIHANDTSEWSDVRNLTVIGEATLKKPTDGSETDPLVDFQCRSIPGVINYLFQVSDDENYTNAISISTTEVDLESDTLEFGTTYYWRVALEHDLDISDWTPSFTFDVKASPALYTPSDGETNLTPRPTLRWEKMSGPTTFNIQYAFNESFDNAIMLTLANTNSTSTESYTFPNAIDSAAVVYWRVRANINAVSSDWSDARSFTIAGTGINDVESFASVEVYPNPNNGSFSISFANAESANVNVQIIDIIGQVVYNENVNVGNGINSKMINANLPEGVYILKLQQEEKIYTDKITIRK